MKTESLYKEAQGYKLPFYSDERPDFGPTQVRRVDEIKKDQVLIIHTRDRVNGNWFQQEVKVIRLYNNSEGILFMEFDYSNHYPNVKNFNSLSDYNVIPERNGKWNAFNWLEDPTKSTPTTSEVE